jgi:hypothetical protein
MLSVRGEWHGALALQLLAVNAVVPPPPYCWPTEEEAADLLTRGKIDAAFLVTPLN